MKNKWLWLGLGIFGLMVILFVVVGVSAFSMFKSISGTFTGPNSPVGTVEMQLKDLKQGDLTSAYTLFSNVGKANISSELFKKFVTSNPTLSNYKTDSFANQKILNDQATLTGTITGEDGTKLPIEYRLVNENGSWKILSIVIDSPIQ